MKKISVIGATLVGAAVLLATPVSLHQSREVCRCPWTRRRPSSGGH